MGNLGSPWRKYRNRVVSRSKSYLRRVRNPCLATNSPLTRIFPPTPLSQEPTVLDTRYRSLLSYTGEITPTASDVHEQVLSAFLRRGGVFCDAKKTTY